MALDGQAVVLPDLYVHSDHPAAAEQFEDRGVQHQGAAVSDTALDDQVRPHLPYQLLEYQDVLRELDDGDAEPGQFVRQLALPARPGKQIGNDLEPLRRVDVYLAGSALGLDRDPAIGLLLGRVGHDRASCRAFHQLMVSLRPARSS